ncbi:MAG: RDD family protein [Bdellovibrionota bacterium]
MVDNKKWNDEELSFRPVSDGLGFHPFSDGLPYAPQSKTIKQQKDRQTKIIEAGATMAAPPIFVHKAPVIKPAVQLSKKWHDQLVNKHIDKTTDFGAKYLFKRIIAYLVDSALNLVISSVVLYLLLYEKPLNVELILNSGVVLIFLIFTGVINWASITSQEVVFGTSIGKRLFGLTIDGKIIATFIRALLFVLSIGFGGIGLLWAVFDGKKRCWHDLVMGLQPEEKMRL